MLWLNCYFPTDPHSIVYDDQELNIILDEIERILYNNVYDDCIVGGDLNFDPSRNSGFANTIKEFMLKIGLISVWDRFSISFTHIHTDMKSMSCIDHFFVNEDLLNRVEDTGVIHLGDNLSRHSPIMMSVRLPLDLMSRKDFLYNSNMRKTACHQDDLDVYTYTLQENVKKLDPWLY